MGLPVVFKATMGRSAHVARNANRSRASVSQLLSQAALAARARRKGAPGRAGGVYGGPLRGCLMQGPLRRQVSAAVADGVWAQGSPCEWYTLQSRSSGKAADDMQTGDASGAQSTSAGRRMEMNAQGQSAMHKLCVAGTSAMTHRQICTTMPTVSCSQSAERM